MTWQWRYQGSSSGSEVGEVSEEFPSQSDAESWLGEQWRELLAAGVDEVVLEENGRKEYAMPLTAE
ncbi:hypothetical protein [Cryptosporangium aurantiacum]|uniref:Uncharacterized protein n=1 Tax=Cryptosporangium aurantiacum TaxID=134849 RepID=A0A1M7R7X7_9ACTN|nr:hypothetical protein [Cryptosporangium aurantiacum]SHN42336.1 hypothetical protein SAMN05443668_108177 [Cryptosporangium aurantiacum]